MDAPELNSARPGSAWLENIAPADVCDIEPARLRWGARNGRSSPLGSAGALEMAARTRSNSLGFARALEIARPGCSKTLHLPTFPSSSPLGLAGRSTLALEPARLRWTGDASLGRTTDACCAQHRDEHTPCMVCTGPPQYIYIFSYELVSRS